MCFQQIGKQGMSFSKSNLNLQNPPVWQTATEIYLRRLNQEGEPVTFRKLSKTPKGDYILTHPKGVLYKSQHCLTLITIKNISKKGDFIRAQHLGIFDAMGWIKFLPGKKTINHLAKPVVYVKQFYLTTSVT